VSVSARDPEKKLLFYNYAPTVHSDVSVILDLQQSSEFIPHVICASSDSQHTGFMRTVWLLKRLKIN
jgi:hypothetical protein